MNKYSEIEYIQNNPFCSEWKTAADGQYKGYTFAIMYNGVNPCAYVMLPKSHVFYDLLCDLATNLNLGDAVFIYELTKDG